MADVTLSFVANDQGVIQSLRRQEAAVASSITRMNAQSASITRKFVGVSAVGGFLGGLGVGAAFAVANKLIGAYAESSEDAKNKVEDLGRGWDRFWGFASEGVADAIGQIHDGTKEFPRALQPLFGLFGLYNEIEEGPLGAMRDADVAMRSLDKWAASVKTSMEASAKATAALAVAAASRDRAAVGLETYGDEFKRRRALAFIDFREEERRIDGLAKTSTNPAEISTLREANRLKLEGVVQAANAAEDRATKDKRETDDAEANEYARRRAAAKENASVELESLRIAAMRARGMSNEADAAERELELRTKILAISRLQDVNASDRNALLDAATDLFAAKSLGDAGRAFGGRGGEAGLAAASGVVRGSLVATARENPAALQRETNQILRQILDRVGGDATATFAPCTTLRQGWATRARPQQPTAATISRSR